MASAYDQPRSPSKLKMSKKKPARSDDHMALLQQAMPGWIPGLTPEEILAQHAATQPSPAPVVAPPDEAKVRVLAALLAAEEADDSLRAQSEGSRTLVPGPRGRMRMKVGGESTDAHIAAAKARQAAMAAGVPSSELPEPMLIGQMGDRAALAEKEQAAIKGAVSSKQLRRGAEEPRRKLVMQKAQNRTVGRQTGLGNLSEIDLVRSGLPPAVVAQLIEGRQQAARDQTQLTAAAEERRHRSEEAEKDRTARRREGKLTMKGQRKGNQQQNEFTANQDRLRQESAVALQKWQQEFDAKQALALQQFQAQMAAAEAASREKISAGENQTALDAARLERGIGVPTTPAANAQAAVAATALGPEAVGSEVAAVQHLPRDEALRILQERGITPTKLREYVDWVPWGAFAFRNTIEEDERRRLQDFSRMLMGQPAPTGPMRTWFGQ